MSEFAETQTGLPTMEHKGGTYVTVGYIARLYEVDERSVQNWAKDYGIVKNGRGEYNLISCIRLVYHNQRDLINRKMGEEGSQKRTMELEKIDEQVRQLKLENAKLEGKLRDVDKVKQVAYSRAKREADMLCNLPSRLKSILAAEQDEFKIGEILKEEIEGIMNKIIEMSKAEW